MKTGDAVIYFQPETIFGRYPATEALYRIGKPSLPALIKVITYVASENAIYTVMMIFREELSEGVKYLRGASSKAVTSEDSRRLNIASQKLEETAKKLDQNK